MNITQKFVDGVRANSERQTFRDDSQTGFGLRIETTERGGRKSYFWNAKVGGHIFFRSLGETSAVSLKDARYDASVLAGKARDWKKGGCLAADNPFIERAEPENAVNAVPTFSQLVERYLREHIHNPKSEINHPAVAEKNIRYSLNKYFTSWMARPVDSFTQKDVLALRDSAGSHHHAANRCVQLARALFTWCASDKDGRVPVWPITVNPAAKLTPNTENARERVLSAEELVTLEDTLDKEPGDLTDFIRLSLDTAARKNSLLAMEWTEIDFDARTWRIPAHKSKSGNAYTANLLPRAVQILERRWETRTTSKFVFPGVSAQRGFIHLDKPFQRLVARIGGTLADVRIHDLRRSSATYQAKAGVPLQKIARTLGHSEKNMSSVLIYAKLADEDAREARETGDAKMRELMDKARARMKRQKNVPTVPRRKSA